MLRRSNIKYKHKAIYYLCIRINSLSKYLLKKIIITRKVGKLSVYYVILRKYDTAYKNDLEILKNIGFLISA